jgi:PAS domain S-box-containing protein
MPSKKSSLTEKKTQSFNPEAGPGKEKSHLQNRNDEESPDAIGESAGTMDASKEELQHLAGELHTVLEAAPVAIWIAHDPQCRHITGNAYADELIMNVPRGGNISRSAKPGEAAVSYKVFRNGKELEPDEMPAQIAAATGRAVNDQELDLVFPEGRTVHLLMGALPLFDAQGRVRGSVATGTDITRMKQAEEALRRSEEQLRLAQESASVGIWDWNLETGSVDFTPELNKLYGLKSGTITKYQDWRDRVHPDDIGWIETLRDEAIARQEPFDLEFRGRHASGEYRWISTKGGAIYNKAGKAIRIFGINIDITLRKQAEEALQQSEARFRAMADAMPQLAWIANPDGWIHWYNHRWYEYTGTAPEQMEGWGWQRVHDPDLLPAILERWKSSLATGESFEMVFPLRGADGRFRRFLTRGHPMKDPQGRVVQWFGTNTNVDELKRTEDALKESEERLRFALQTIQTGAWDLDLVDHTSFRSLEHDRIFGYAELLSEWTYETFINHVLPEDRQEVDSKFRQAMETNGDWNFECRIRRATGEICWIMAAGRHRPDAAGASRRMAGIVQDITARKLAEETLRQSRADLEQRVQDRTRELSQTVAALNERSEQLHRMAAELTLAEQRERQRLAQILHDGLQQILVGAKFRLASIPRSQNVPKATSEVTELIDDAIETSRSLTAELSPPILMHCDLFLALEWLARWMRDKYELNINLIAQQKIEAMAQELIILLFQATRELLFNVVKHAGVKDARVEARQMDGQVVLTIDDEGAGFNPNRLAESGRSNGMGLFGIRERLSYMGGRMEIDSAPGQGSRFKLIVPLAPVDAKAATKSPDKPSQVSVAVSSHANNGSANSAKRTRIILVDDHLVMRQGLAGLLRIYPDFEIVGEASDGESALVLVRELKPDVVLMDIGMPGMDGVQATRILHKELPGIRIIGLSMFQEGEQQAAMREAGAADYITKSGPSEALIEAVRACVRNRE